MILPAIAIASLKVMSFFPHVFLFIALRGMKGIGSMFSTS